MKLVEKSLDYIIGLLYLYNIIIIMYFRASNLIIFFHLRHLRYYGHGHWNHNIGNIHIEKKS